MELEICKTDLEQLSLMLRCRNKAIQELLHPRQRKELPVNILGTAPKSLKPMVTYLRLASVTLLQSFIRLKSSYSVELLAIPVAIK